MPRTAASFGFEREMVAAPEAPVRGNITFGAPVGKHLVAERGPQARRLGTQVIEGGILLQHDAVVPVDLSFDQLHADTVARDPDSGNGGFPGASPPNSADPMGPFGQNPLPRRPD